MVVDLGVTAWSALVGTMGGVLWWASPPKALLPRDFGAVLKRLVVGAVCGFLANVLVGLSPIDASGNWNPAGIVELVVVGFGGIASLVGILPASLRGNLSVVEGGDGGPAAPNGGGPAAPPGGGGSQGTGGAPLQQQPSGGLGSSLVLERKDRTVVKSNLKGLRVMFQAAEKDADYFVSLTPHWLTTVDVVDRDPGGFTVEFGSPPRRDSELDYMIAR